MRPYFGWTERVTHRSKHAQHIHGIALRGDVAFDAHALAETLVVDHESARERGELGTGQFYGGQHFVSLGW